MFGNYNFDFNLLIYFVGSGKRHLEIYKLNEMISETVDGRYKCERCCKATYKHKRNLYNHLRVECGIDPAHKCQFCDYRAKRFASVKKHTIAVHKLII